MYKEIKPMLTPSELIEHLESKGVKFELINKEDAQKYLEENNNYFKLVSYRKNFPKYENGENCGKYINLDFNFKINEVEYDFLPNIEEVKNEYRKSNCR